MTILTRTNVLLYAYSCPPSNHYQLRALVLTLGWCLYTEAPTIFLCADHFLASRSPSNYIGIPRRSSIHDSCKHCRRSLDLPIVVLHLCALLWHLLFLYHFYIFLFYLLFRIIQIAFQYTYSSPITYLRCNKFACSTFSFKSYERINQDERL
jgi:hypothetical protein